jgi:hypothetical protein
MLAPPIWRCRRPSVEEICSRDTSSSKQFAPLAEASLHNITLDLTEYVLALIGIGGINPERMHIVTVFQHRAGVVTNLAKRPKVGVSFVPNIVIAYVMYFDGGRFAENAETMIEF